MVSWWKIDSHLNYEQIQKGVLYLLMIHMVHQDNLDQDLDQNILDKKHVHIEKLFSV